MDKHMEKRRKWNALLGGAFQNDSPEWIRLRTGLMTAIAVMLVMSAAMGSAWAFFTTYARAKGSYVIQMGHQETVEEQFSGWEKKINIASTSDSRPVYIRARAFCADYKVTYDNNDNWTPVDEWMYYTPKTKTLAPGEGLLLEDENKKVLRDDRLKVQINGVPESTDPTIKEGDTFNVIVIYETTEVQYDKDGNPLDARDADWDAKVDTSRTTTTLGGDKE